MPCHDMTCHNVTCRERSACSATEFTWHDTWHDVAHYTTLHYMQSASACSATECGEYSGTRATLMPSAAAVARSTLLKPAHLSRSSDMTDRAWCGASGPPGVGPTLRVRNRQRPPAATAWKQARAPQQQQPHARVAREPPQRRLAEIVVHKPGREVERERERRHARTRRRWWWWWHGAAGRREGAQTNTTKTVAVVVARRGRTSKGSANKHDQGGGGGGGTARRRRGRPRRCSRAWDV